MTHPHPEWKRLYENLLPSLSPSREYSYDELSSMSGIDVTSGRGRKQFHRCAREVLLTHRLYFENIKGVGYRLIHPNETPYSMQRQAGKAIRATKRSCMIGLNSRIEEMRPETSAELRRQLAAQGSMLQAMRSEQRQTRKAIASMESSIAVVRALVEKQQS